MTTTSDLTRWLAAVRDLEPVIRRHAAEAERERRLGAPVVEAMRDAGLFDLWRPAAFGGHEVGPSTGLSIIEEVSRIDSAAGWNLMICLATESFGAWFSEEIASRTFGKPGVIMAGAFNPPRRAVPVEGGYRVTGRTPFVSGVHQADFVNGLAQVMDGDDVRLGPDGLPVVLQTVFPIADVEIVENWNTMGMRGTGSDDVVVTDCFVPDEHTAPYVPLETMPPAYDAPLHRLTVWPAVAAVATPALGVAQAAIDALIELATVKTPAYTTRSLADRSVVAAQLARAEALVASARALLHQTFDDALAHVTDGGFLTQEHKVRVQLASTNVVVASGEAVGLVHAAAGASGIREEQPFERHFRDAHSLTQHAFVCANRYEDVGRHRMGREPEWGFFAF